MVSETSKPTFLGRMRAYPSGTVGLALVGSIAILGLLAPVLPIRDPLALDLGQRLAQPGLGHLLGTDQAGRDVLSRIIWGSRESLLIALSAVLFGCLFGVTLGLIAGYKNGSILEMIITRCFDILFSIPLLILAIALLGILGTQPITIGGILISDEMKLIVLIGFSFTPALGRVAYAAALVEARSEYVRAKKAQGAGWAELTFIDILPNAIPSVIVQATLFIGVAIIVEASLSFVGLGVQPPTPSWGTMLADARNYIFSGEWWVAVFPGLAICATVVGFNLMGDVLRDLLDPRGGAKSTFV
jgi:peptide/nickel transport system permease protein